MTQLTRRNIITAIK